MSAVIAVLARGSGSGRAGGQAISLVPMGTGYWATTIAVWWVRAASW
ncbi:hypothetical protein [Solihabitans fulvus]|nr:hypothetical protein [Solihabitans fulvus]